MICITFYSEIGNCCNNLDDLWCSKFTCWQVKHLDKISFLNLCTSSIHSLVPICNVPSLSITKSRDWPCCTSIIIFCNWGSLLWATLTHSKYTNRTLNRDKMHFSIAFNYSPRSTNSCSYIIIDLLSVLMCARLSVDFLFTKLATTFVLLGW